MPRHGRKFRDKGTSSGHGLSFAWDIMLRDGSRCQQSCRQQLLHARHSSARASNSATGTRARVARVRAKYPSQLDYSGFWMAAAASLNSHERAATWNLAYCQGALQNDGVICLMPRAYHNGSQYKTK